LLALSRYFHAGIGAYFVPVGSNLVGSFIGDEGLYRLYAESLRHLQSYPADALYPPAYPLLLAASELFSPSDPIKGMIIANITVASAVMFPIYALARQMLERVMAFGAALVAGLLPASFIFAPALMSENLSTSLFVTAFWLAIRSKQASVVSAALFGVVLAACFLAKFLFLAITPFLAAAFVFKQWSLAKTRQTREPARLTLRLMISAIVGTVVPIAAWNLYFVASGGTIAKAFGFQVALMGVKAGFPAFTSLAPILGLHFLALVASSLPLLPAVLTAINRPRQPLILLYFSLLGTIILFLLVFVTAYAWLSTKVFGYPQPIIQRYFMMLVPIFIPLAFFGLTRTFGPSNEGQSWQALVVPGLTLALAFVVQAGLYDRTIWPVPKWVTVIWVGGPDVLYGALGFPVIAVAGISAASLIVLRTAVSMASRVASAERKIKLFITGFATIGWSVFYVASGWAGTHFAWDNPYLTANSAHARAITAIIGDRSQNAQTAVVIFEPTVLESIEATTGIHILNEERWSVNLWFWSGRRISVHGVGDISTSKLKPDYWVSLARPGANSKTVYTVGVQRFQVTTKSPRP
jgi:hypothetical protein